MPCKHYKEALGEAAASGSEPQGELRAHLAACADCRAAFEREQSLFASIDAGQQLTANTEVPASLFPRVRAALAEETMPTRGWVIPWFALASAAVVFVAFFAARAFWHTNVAHQPVETAGNSSVPPPQKRETVAVPPVNKNSVSTHPLAVVKKSPMFESLPQLKSTPEVLVPRDQELLLADYAEQWGLRKQPLLVAQDFDATILAPLRVAPIQIDELGVKPLAEEKAQ